MWNCSSGCRWGKQRKVSCSSSATERIFTSRINPFQICRVFHRLISELMQQRYYTIIYTLSKTLWCSVSKYENVINSSKYKICLKKGQPYTNKRFISILIHFYLYRATSLKNNEDYVKGGCGSGGRTGHPLTRRLAVWSQYPNGWMGKLLNFKALNTTLSGHQD